MKLILVSVIVLLALNESVAKSCTCGKENIGSRIIGGTVVSESKYPWMTWLLFRNWRMAWSCGGSLVNDRYILTAGHCVSDRPTEAVAFLGSNIKRKGRMIKIIQIINHVPPYNPRDNHNDIAILKLAEPIEFTREISPICLPNPDMLDFTTLTVAGWGKTSGFGSSSDQMLEVTVNQTPFDECNRYRRNRLIDSQLCAAEIGKDSCQGDSGGPLMTRERGKMFVVGIVSYGSARCGADRNSVYTRVTSFLDWIQRETSDAESCSD